jgi:DNA invertase Pin-like site-specific DNA recombinase
VHELEQNGGALKVLEPDIDTGGSMGRMVLTVLGMIAEMELSFIRDRQRAGIEAAKGMKRLHTCTRKSGPSDTFSFEKRNNQTVVEL